MIALLGIRFLSAAILAGAAVALTIGIPTDVVPNPWFTRMTPVRTLDVSLLVLTSVLLGPLIVTYAPQWAGGGRVAAPFASGTLGWLAIGCPLCNKIVLALLGTSGSLSYFAPVQPALGAFAVGLAGIALWLRLRRSQACRVTTAATPDT